jgi:intergrase/recombinase
MTIALDDYDKLKREYEKTQRQMDEAKGAIKQELASLLHDYGVESEEAAGELLKKLEAKQEKATVVYEEALDAYKKAKAALPSEAKRRLEE